MILRFFIALALVLSLLPAPVLAASVENAGDAAETGKKPVKVLILPKFEVGAIDEGFPGEAYYYYRHYLEGSEAYEVPGGMEGSKLYYKDGVALYLLGMGKVNAALSTTAVLDDERFDFSGAYILSTGGSGVAAETSVMGDVAVVTAAVNYDFGHHADARDIADPEGITWFRDSDQDTTAVIRLDPDLTGKVYEMVRDVPLETTERTRNEMRKAFDGADWALRDPKVLRGTAMTSDSYWKGWHDHANAMKMAEAYSCTDPYTVTEMEDYAVARAVQRKGMMNRLIILRVGVNMDVFMSGATPESLWGAAEPSLSLATEDNTEAVDVFAIAMKNNFEVGRVIIGAVLNGEL